MTGESVLPSGLRQDVVDKQMLVALYAEPTLINRVLNKTADVKRGERVSIGIIPTLTVASVSQSDGTYSPAAVTPTATEVIVDQHGVVVYKVLDFSLLTSVIDLEEQIGNEFGRALAEAIDAHVYDQDSSITQSVGSSTSPAAMSDALARAAIRTLDKLNVPRRDRTFALSVDAESDLLGDARFTEAQNTGFARGLQIDGGRIAKLYGVEVITSTNVNEDDVANTNLLLQKNAIGVVIPQKIRMHEGDGLSADSLLKIIAGDAVYGADVVRANHGVKIYSAYYA